MPVRIVDDPIGDPRWSALVDRHPAASVFHSPGWLTALRQTYGYEPFVLTSSPGSSLDNGLVLCRIKGWTARRLVSLPFSDHCDPLVDAPSDLSEILGVLAADARQSNWQSVELRPQAFAPAFDAAARAFGMEPAGAYCLHRLDLRPPASELFRRLHPSSTQRAVRRAEREGLICESGTSDDLLASFYRLLRMTRRRHGLPPQPLDWFHNLIRCLGNQVAIHVARKDDQPIAAMLTLSFRQTLFYKYGGSDAAYHRLGGMPFLFWQVIQDGRARGFTELDLGRSDLAQTGLTTFKDHLGAVQSPLTYYRQPAARAAGAHGEWVSRAARGVLSRLPDAALDAAGRLLYKHLG